LPVILLGIYPCSVLIANGVDGIWDDIIHGEISASTPAFTGNVSRYTSRFVYATFIAMVVFKRFSINDYKNYLFGLSKVINVFLVVGIVEFLFKMVLGLKKTWGVMMETMLGFSESTVYDAELRGDSYGINLFTRESSHFAFTLLLCLIINMAINICKGRKNGINRYTFVILVLMLLSTSFSMVLFLAAFITIFLLYRWTVLCPPSMKREILTLIIVILSCSSLLVAVIVENSDGFVAGRLLNLTSNIGDFFNMDADGKYSSSLGDFSAFARIYSVVMTLSAFVARPLFGISLGAAYCHGATAMLLSGIGIVGVFFLLRFYFYGLPYQKCFQAKKATYSIAVFVYFFVNLFNSLELKPFCNTTLIAVSICFCVIFSCQNKKLKKIQYDSKNYTLLLAE
jgi:hypothetical protein